MEAGGAGRNGDGVARLGTEHLARRRDQLGQHQRRGGRCSGLQVVARGGEGALEGAGEGEAREPGVERLEAAPVVLARHGPRRKERLGPCRSEEHTSELQSLAYLVCRLLLEKKKKKTSTCNKQETA